MSSPLLKPSVSGKQSPRRRIVHVMPSPRMSLRKMKDPEAAAKIMSGASQLVVSMVLDCSVHGAWSLARLRQLSNPF